MCNFQIMRLVLCFYLITPYTVRISNSSSCCCLSRLARDTYVGLTFQRTVLAVCSYSQAGSSSRLMKLLRFRIAFTTAHYLSVSWATWHQSTLSNPILLRSFLILFLHVRLVLTIGLFPSPIRATCPAHLILVNLITPRVSVAYKPCSLSLSHFHQLLLTSSQNIASLL
jgi:hypothetical protein